MKWSLTGGGRLREVVALRELTVFQTYNTPLPRACRGIERTEREIK